MKIFQINAETGEAFERDATSEEIAEIEKTQLEAQALKQNSVVEKENKEELKSSAISKLVDLGLTEDEAKAFLG